MSSRRRYLNLGVIALTLALVYGIWYSYSVFMVALLKEFGWSRSVVAGAFSAFTLTHGVASPLLGILCTRLQPQVLVAWGSVLLGVALWADSWIETPLELYLGFGVCTAAAVALAGWTPALVQVQRRFQDRLGLALGIVSAGVGLGMLLMVPLCQLLIDAFGWRTAFRAIAVICVAWILPASIYLLRTAPAPPPESGPAPRDGTAPAHAAPGAALTLREALRTTPFWLLLAASFFGNMCSQTLHVHQVAFLVDHGVAAIVAASVVGVVGVSSIVSKIAGGWISDRVEREVVFVCCIGIMVSAVGALAWVGTSPTRWGAYGYGILLGAGYAVTASMIPAMASDRFGGRHFSAIMGFCLFGSAMGSALGPWLAGRLFDLTGSYDLPFVIAATCGVVAGSAGWMARVLRLRAKNGIAA